VEEKMSKKQLILGLIVIIAFILPVFLIEAEASGYKTANIKKEGKSYSVDIEYPEITNKRLAVDTQQKVNDAIKMFVHKLFDHDLKTFVETEPKWTKKELEGIASGNLVDLDFKIIRLDQSFVSIRFEKYTYGIGAAHGLTHIAGFNYDAGTIKQINLADLFKPGTDYLKQISDYSILDLKKQLNKESNYADENWIREGASPTEENFREFALTKDCLIIFFNDYQVACHAAGTPEVKIPFKKLSNLEL
jgi:hypothetical protein